MQFNEASHLSGKLLFSLLMFFQFSVLLSEKKFTTVEGY